MSLRPTPSIDEPLLDVTSHITALQVTLRSLQRQYANNDEVVQVLDDVRSRCGTLATVAADVSSYLREAHSFDPLLGVSREAELSAVSLITAFLDGVEQDGDHQLLYDLLEELFTRPDTSYRALAGVMAALVRDAATLALRGGSDSPPAALALLRDCLSVPAH
jgi:hypothetical protein